MAFSRLGSGWTNTWHSGGPENSTRLKTSYTEVKKKSVGKKASRLTAFSSVIFSVQLLLMRLYIKSRKMANRTEIVLVWTFLAELYTCIQINVSPVALPNIVLACALPFAAVPHICFWSDLSHRRLCLLIIMRNDTLDIKLSWIQDGLRGCSQWDHLPKKLKLDGI